MSFRPMTVYDAPYAILDQVADDPNMGDLMDTLFNQGRGLSPSQRENWFTQTAENLDKNVGTVAGATFRTITNPWVLLSLVLSPSAGAAKRGASAKLFNDKLRKSILPEFLQGMRTANSFAHGTSAGAVAHRMVDVSQRLRRQWGGNRRLAESEVMVISKLFEVPLDKVKSVHRQMYMDPDLIQNPALQAKVRKAHVLIGADQAGVGRAASQEVYDYVPEMWTWVDGKKLPIRDEKLRARIWRTRREAAQNPGARKASPEGAVNRSEMGLEGEGVLAVSMGGKRRLTVVNTIEDAPLVEYGSIHRSMMQLTGDDTLIQFSGRLRETLGDRMVTSYMKKGTTYEQVKDVIRNGKPLEDLVDEDKIRRLWSRRDSRSGSGAVSEEIDDALERLVGDETLGRLRATTTSEAFDVNLAAWKATGSGKQPKIPSNYLSPDERLTYEAFSKDIRKMVVSGLRSDSYLPRTGGRTLELNNTTGAWEDITDNADLARGETATVGAERGASGRGIGRVEDVTRWSVEELGILRSAVGSDSVTDGWTQAVHTSLDARARVLPTSGPRPVRELSLDYRRPVDMYEKQTMRDFLLFGDDPLESADILRAHNTMVRQYVVNEDVYQRSNIPRVEGIPKDGSPNTRSLIQEIEGIGVRPDGGWSNADLLDASHEVIRRSKNRLGRQAETQGVRFKTSVVGAALGHRPRMQPIGTGLVTRAQEAAGSLVESNLMRELAGDTDVGRALSDSLGRFANSNSERLTRTMNTNIAGHLYATHLGLNIGSVIMNLQQPFLLMAPWAGARETVKVYKEIFRDAQAYGRERARHVKSNGYTGMRALNLTGDDRLEIARKAGIQGFEEAGLSGNMLEDLDSIAYGMGHKTLEGNASYWTIEAPMKMFEKAEWVNRLVAAKVMRNRYLVSNGVQRTEDLSEDVADEMRRQMSLAVEETQFGSTAMNTPDWMSQNPWLRNPLLRQFMTFPMRSLTAPTEAAQRVGLDRTFRNGWQVPLTGRDDGVGAGARLATDFVRTFGIGAATYYGAQAIGLDFSRGGAAEALKDASKLELLSETGQAEWTFRLPPAAGIPMDLIKSVIQGDATLASQTVLRLLPGGVAAIRAAGVLNDNGNGVPLMDAAQRQFVDWNSPNSEGMFPVFRNTGTFVGYENGLQILLKGLGVPLDSHKKGAEMDRYLASQRQEIVAMRNEALNAMLANNPTKARRMQAEFQNKFGVPLTFTQRQLRGRIQSRSVGRTERMLDMMPTDVREVYQRQLAEGAAARSGTTIDEFINKTTSRQRERLGGKQLTQDDINELRAMQTTPEGQRAAETWTPYSGF